MSKFLKICCFIAFFISVISFGQTQFSGVVYDDWAQPLPDAVVSVKGTSISVTTDTNGAFVIEIPEGETIIEISSEGFQMYEFNTSGKLQGEITLTPNTDLVQLDDVVVTALNIKRDRKSLGYASQELDSEDLVQSNETNFLNSMSGKVAGMNVTNSPTGLGGSALVTLRGNRSLNISKNSPLYVIDGTPITNNVGSLSGSGTQDTDYGNGAGEINPENIESINVLKGPAAAALYGSRAANGAIIITTKNGSSKKGKLQVNFNSSTSFQTILTMPDWQNEYGQGNNMEFSFVDGAGSGVNDGVDESWGPRLDIGLLIPQFDSPREDGTRGGDIHISDSPITATPWVSQPNNINDFFDTGVTFKNSLGFSKSGDIGSFRVSYENMDQKGIVPNTDLKRNNFNVSGLINLTDNLKLNTNINYLKQTSDNRPSLSYGTENIMYLWTWFGRNINMRSLRDYWQPGLEGIQQFNYNYNYHDNPYFNVYENTNGQNKDRVYGNVSLTWNISENWTAMFRSGRDFYRDFLTKRRAYSTQRFPYGFYREDDNFVQESNTDVLITYDKTFGEKWNLNISAGANRMDYKNNYKYAFAGRLIIPGLYSLNNAQAGTLEAYQSNSKKRINSVYGFGRFSWDESIFLELTARNDWSSTVNDPYFYPSANLSFVLSNLMDLPEFLSFAKLRGAIAQVGNDTDPYNLVNVYNTETAFGEYSVLTEDSTFRNPDLKPEETTSYEVGLNLGFLKNRINLDATYYTTITTNQILKVDADISSGYSGRFVNLGEVENKGFEALLEVKPFANKNFKWNATFNFATNESIVSKMDGIDYTLTSRNGVYIQAREGQSISAIYGYGFKRVEDENSPYYGEIIYGSDGLPTMTDDLVYQGDYAPDWTLGINNSFKIFDFDFSFLFDIRQGGIVVSRTKTIASTSGQLAETLVGREDGIVGDGVVVNSDGTYSPNTTNVGARSWNYSYYDRDNVEAAKYDASFTKLREVTLGYTIPRKYTEKIFAESIRLSVSGRNLILWTENPHFDPETLSMSGSTLQPGIEDMSLPSTRSFTFNVNINF